MSETSELIASEIADFFAGFGGPGEPDIQSGEAQRLLTERLLSVLALRERAEPVYQLWSSGINQWVECDKGRYEAHAHVPAQRRVLYTAPTAPVVPECIERLLRHAHGLTLGTDWNAGTAAKFHRDPLIQAVNDCRSLLKQPLSVEVLAGALRNAPLAPSDNQGHQRENDAAIPPATDEDHWYLVSWCSPGGRYGSTEIRLNRPWSKGSMRSATKMIADYNDLEHANVVILSVFPIAAPQSTN
ncbi:hypothetical protein ACOZZZ_002589 [Cronobacter malonaticus]